MKNHNHSLQQRDQRWIIALAIASYVFLVCIAGQLGGHATSQHLLQFLGVPALEHPFMDMRGVAAWCEAAAEGKNPSLKITYITFPGEKPVRDFLMNYSPLVLTLGRCGLDQNHAGAWALILASLYAISLWFLFGAFTTRQAFLWSILILSPASVMVVERGNLDMMLFVLIVASLLLRKNALGSTGPIMLAACIKFFPIGALVAPWRESGKANRMAVILATAVFLTHLFFLNSSLAQIRTSLTGQYQSAFGCTVSADLLRHYGLISDWIYGLIRIGLTVMGCLFVAILGISGHLTLKPHTRKTLSNRMLYAFFLTAPFMLGLFVLGNQMDYKWIFFLPMVPAMLELLDSPDELESKLSKIWIGGILVYSYWTFFSDEGSLRNALFKQVVMWVVMLSTAFLAGRLWKKEEVR